MVLEIVLHESSIDGLNTVCAACKKDIADGYECLFKRVSPSGPCVVLCIECSRSVCQAAVQWMDIQLAVQDMFST